MGGTSLAQLVAKQRGRTRESPHLWFSRVFYEASRDLGSQPTPRNRPRRSLSSPGVVTPILVVSGRNSRRVAYARPFRFALLRCNSRNSRAAHLRGRISSQGGST